MNQIKYQTNFAHTKIPEKAALIPLYTSRMTSDMGWLLKTNDIANL